MGCNWYLVAEARNAAKHPAMHRTVPTIIIGTKIAIVLRLRNLD